MGGLCTKVSIERQFFEESSKTKTEAKQKISKFLEFIVSKRYAKLKLSKLKLPSGEMFQNSYLTLQNTENVDEFKERILKNIIQSNENLKKYLPEESPAADLLFEETLEDMFSSLSDTVFSRYSEFVDHHPNIKARLCYFN